MKNIKRYIALSRTQKRDGTIVPFDQKRIHRAILQAMNAIKGVSQMRK